MTLNGTVAVVTGASSGIGRAVAEALAQEGAAVALVARREDRIQAVADELRSRGAEAMAFPADLTTERSEELVGKIVERMGRLDTLVNAAGVMLVGPAAEAPLEEWQRTVDLNVSALLEMTHAALPQLRKAAQTSPRGVADIVNVSSVAGRSAIGGAAVYSASKFRGHRVQRGAAPGTRPGTRTGVGRGAGRGEHRAHRAHPRWRA